LFGSHAEIAFGRYAGPYYTGNFEEVYHLVSDAADGLLSVIRRENGL
jgi:hypothetical protein